MTKSEQRREKYNAKGRVDKRKDRPQRKSRMAKKGLGAIFSSGQRKKRVAVR